jgi:hypothetical protein
MRSKKAVVSVVAPLAALLLVGAYIAANIGLLALDRRLSLVAALSLGVMGVVGSLAFGDLLSRGRPNFTARVGCVFGVVAFAIWVVVTVIQRGTPELWRRFVSTDLAAVLPGGPETVKQLYLGVSRHPGDDGRRVRHLLLPRRDALQHPHAP